MEKIREAWLVYLGKVAEGNKLYAEGDKLCAEGSKLCAEDSKLRAEGSKLCAEGDKLCAEGRIAFFQVVISTLGNVPTKWLDCWNRLEIAGMVYTSNLEDAWNTPAACEGKVVEIDGKKYRLSEVK